MKQDLYNQDWIDIDGNSIHKTAIIHPNVVLGKGNVIGAYCVIGGNGEIRGVMQADFKGTVHIGNNNVISEHVTIQRPLKHGKSTVIGNENLIMAHAHIGHDAYIGNGCEICTSSVIGGFVTIYDRVKVKLNCTIRNRLIIGMDSIIGMGSVVTKDVPPFTTVYGNPAREKEKTIDEQVEELKSQLARENEMANAMFVTHAVGSSVFPEKTKAILFWGAICVGIGMLIAYLFMI